MSVVQAGMAVAFGMAATVEDLRSRQIPNWIPVSALAAGVVWHLAVYGWRGVGASLLGAVAGFGVFLIFYLLGGMGGGDIKLMSGFGAVIGIAHILAAAYAAAICGAVLAVFVLCRRAWRRRREPSREGAGGESASIPYAPAIAAGVWLSLIA
ncbi:MAG TPA: A24 family peptidase [Bryobacteraceae bacterium]|nr:A24 family peptidase [Bryobacteraceae bacterium]